jgi:UDP-N-acetylglucosamine--N-acetylmuramyl-(pentapeptide) pyrophosphoryl-undecaprenol N-acetylglucosamine transferase
MKSARILVATGASGGHIFPALAFLEALKEKHPQAQALLLAPEKSKEKVRIDDCAYPVTYVRLASFKPGINRETVKNALGLFRGVLQSLRAVLKFHPDIVVGFGSIASVPAVFFGWLLRAKTIIHEQNVLPGKATRLLAEVADKLALSFEQSRSYFKRHKDKIIVTGNPLRKKISVVTRQEALKYLGLEKGKITILVMGGSQASRRINEESFRAFSLFEDKSKLQVIHLAGRHDYAELKERYAGSGIGCALFDFFGPMHYAYSCADLAISRAGATSIAELTYFRLPAILIPYPHARAHQQENAKALEEKGCACIIREEELSVGLLKEKMEGLLKDPAGLARMRENYRAFKAEAAASALVEQALKFD